MRMIADYLSPRRFRILIGGGRAFFLLCLAFTGCQHQSAKTALPVLTETNQLATTTPSTLAKVCFARGDYIYLKDLASGRETRLLKGQSPEISPDGKKVLFRPLPLDNDVSPWPVMMLDLDSKRVAEISALTQLDPRDARWSRDGSKIAFDDARGFGQFDPLTGEWKTIVRHADLGVSDHAGPVALSSWAPNDESVLIHSLEYLYEVSLNGKVVWQMPIAKLGISSETRFSLSSDRRYLLFDSTIDTKERPVNDVIKLLDISNKNLTLITPDTVEARTPIWVNSDKVILFTCMKRFDHPHRPSICTIGVDGTGLSVVVDGGQQPSYSGN